MFEKRLVSFYKGAIQKKEDYLKQFDTSIVNYYKNLEYRLNIFRLSKSNTDQYIASDFNFFDFINPNENMLSDIFSELLEVNGKHGQGSLFLSLFLNITGLSSSFKISEFKSIFREDPTCYINNMSRRIDITLDFGNTGIGIENKPWATDQIDQLEDYKNHLKKKYRSNFILFYLSGDGHKPSSIREHTSNIKIISYNGHIKKWLNECYKESKADKIRWFLHDFISYIEQTFPSFTDEVIYD